METSLHSPDVALQLFSRRTPILRLREMQRIAIFLLLTSSTLSCLAVKPVTADELEQMLAATHDASDAQVAAQLSDLTLIERLSPLALSRCTGGLPGPSARQAFMVLTDMSAFLELPASEIPSLAQPDPEAQRKMIALAVEYVGKTMRQLPNFYATRITTAFQDNPSVDESKTSNRWMVSDLMIISKTLRSVGRYSAAVLYRKGREEVHAETDQSKTQGLTTSGEFGPILSTSLVDAAHGHLVWSHWEQGVSGVEAVFRFAVLADKSHYEVAYCCIIRGNGDRVYYRQFSAYNGEIAMTRRTARFFGCRSRQRASKTLIRLSRPTSWSSTVQWSWVEKPIFAR